MKNKIKIQDLHVNPAIAKQVLADALVPSFYETVINDFHRKVMSEWEEKLKAYLKENLKQFGYEFESDNEFLEFCKRRVNRLCFEDKPNYYEFYLDYVNEENTGKFIGCCSDKVEFVNEVNKMTAIVGKSTD